MPIRLLAVTVLLALGPTVSLAECMRGQHATIKMTCADGMVFDGKAQACVPVTG